MADQAQHRLTKDQRIEIVQTYYRNNDDVSRTTEIVGRLFNRPVSRNTVSALIAKFQKLGFVADAPRSGRPNTAVSDANITEILQRVETSPQKSAKRLALELGFAESSVRRCLHAVAFKPYRPRMVHALHDDDNDRRLEYCETMFDFAAKKRCRQSPMTFYWQILLTN
jgi:transposase